MTEGYRRHRHRSLAETKDIAKSGCSFLETASFNVAVGADRTIMSKLASHKFGEVTTYCFKSRISGLPCCFISPSEHRPIHCPENTIPTGFRARSYSVPSLSLDKVAFPALPSFALPTTLVIHSPTSAIFTRSTPVSQPRLCRR